MEYSFLSLKTTHIGSFPFEDPEKAIDLILDFVDIPAWPQLFKLKNENMTLQFNEGLPGFEREKEIINTSSSNFEEELIKFYELYFEIIERKNLDLLKNFSLSENYAKGFKAFLKRIQNLNFPAVKGQITGPFTLATSLKTENKEILIFREDLKDLITKFLTLKALSQGLELKKVSPIVIIFLDEPALSGFGSSSFITVSKDLVLSILNEMIEILVNFGIITGIHICANTSWDIILESKVNIISFDSFNFYDKLIIYKNSLKNFLKDENKYLAWGVIPTNSEILENISLEEIIHKFKSQLSDLCSTLNISEDKVLRKSFFTPSCGLGSLSESLSIKALKFLKNFKNFIMKE
uniref:Methionine synthase n=1 Tax=Thermodesulfobacterium geofontis TaxID=1295609 RepID=A0A7V4N481_9BACT